MTKTLKNRNELTKHYVLSSNRWWMTSRPELNSSSHALQACNLTDTYASARNSCVRMHWVHACSPHQCNCLSFTPCILTNANRLKSLSMQEKQSEWLCSWLKHIHIPSNLTPSLIKPYWKQLASSLKIKTQWYLSQLTKGKEQRLCCKNHQLGHLMLKATNVSALLSSITLHTCSATAWSA